MDRRLLATTVATAALAGGSARAESHHPVPTIAWVLTQAIPSPGHGWDRDGHTLSLRWQVTPFLYSWGVHRRAPIRFRAFIVEPSLRNTGSIETWIGPEWLRDGHRSVLRGGVRSYFPVAERGDGVSMSIGTGVWTHGREVGPVIEVGMYVLFGVLGVQLSHAPGLEHAEWMATLSWRAL